MKAVCGTMARKVARACADVIVVSAFLVQCVAACSEIAAQLPPQWHEAFVRTVGLITCVAMYWRISKDSEP